MTRAFADWAERRPHLANVLGALFLGVPIAAALGLAGESQETVAIACAAISLTVLAFFEAASWLAGRPVLPALMGGGGRAPDDHAYSGRLASWFGGGDGDGGGGGGGDGGGGG